MFISKHILLKRISWLDIHQSGFMFGRKVAIDGYTYIVRSLTGGKQGSEVANSNEYSQYISSGSASDINRWDWNYGTWTMDREDSNAIVRGSADFERLQQSN